MPQIHSLVPPDFLYIAPIIFGIMVLAYIGDAMVGFGTSVIAVTLGANFYPIELLIPVIVPAHILINGYIAFRHRAHIDGGLLLKRILPLMTLGGAIGLALFPFVKGPALQLIFGVMIVIFTARELIRLVTGGNSARPMSDTESSFWQLGAGRHTRPVCHRGADAGLFPFEIGTVQGRISSDALHGLGDDEPFSHNGVRRKRSGKFGKPDHDRLHTARGPYRRRLGRRAAQQSLRKWLPNRGRRYAAPSRIDPPSQIRLEQNFCEFLGRGLHAKRPLPDESS